MEHSLLNSLFDINIVLDFIKRKNEDYIRYNPSKLVGYKKLMQENLLYPSVKSNKQFGTIIETYTKENKVKYLARLVEIVNKSMKKSNEVDMIKHFVNNSSRSDSEHYDLLRKMLNNGKKGGYISKMHSIYDELSHILNEKNIKPSKIMDIGCGNGRKLEQLGKKFNINPSNLICADIDEWFDYSADKRDKKSFTKLKIDFKGPIIYDKKVDIITMVHTIHHWCYETGDEYIKRMSSLKAILNKEGYIVIVEHDIFTKIDGCILDIEHALYECVHKSRDSCEVFTNVHQARYLNFVEIDIMMEKAGFEIISFRHYNGGSITNLIVPNKTYIAIYKIKNHGV